MVDADRAVGFLRKGVDAEVVLDALRSVAAGGTAWDRRSADILRRSG
jgi:DNA-binding NarL/FixJ family response regulator